MATANPTTASVEFHTRLSEAQSVIDNIVMTYPTGTPINDPISVRIQLLMASHDIEAAIWELERP
jgi:hypothetical protein